MLCASRVMLRNFQFSSFQMLAAKFHVACSAHPSTRPLTSWEKTDFYGRMPSFRAWGGLVGRGGIPSKMAFSALRAFQLTPFGMPIRT